MKGLNGWIKLLEKSETAVLSGLLEELQRITDSDESSALQLGEVILKDSSLTSNIIKIANSAHFNPGSTPVTTISRAILNIGFKNIRSFCVSLKLLETILKESPSPLLVATLAKTFHAASQAKSLCDYLAPDAQEEVYVALMMSHLAELLVLSSNEEDARDWMVEIDAETDTQQKDRVAERTLGVGVTRLSRSLMKRWRIEGLVNEVLAISAQESRMLTAVKLGEEISRAAIIGWDSPEFEEVLKQVADFKGQSIPEVKRAIKETADQAAQTVEQYGKSILVGHIPTSKGAAVKKGKFSVDGKEDFMRPNEQVQLKILQSLTSMLTSEFDINNVFKLVLQGMNEGVGLERVTLAIFDKGQQSLQTKYAKGEGTENWKETFVLKYVRSHSGFLYNLFEKDQMVWVGNPDYRQISQYVTGEYKGLTGQENFFIVPLLAKGKRIGVIYADMGVSKRGLNDQYFAGFCHFAQQAKFALTLLAAR